MKRYKYLIFLVLIALVFAGCIGGGSSLGAVAGYVYIRVDAQAQGLSGADVQPLVLSQAVAPEDYEPLADAVITLAGTSRTAKTNGEGYFYLGGLAPRTYHTISITHPDLRFDVRESFYLTGAHTYWFDRTDPIIAGIAYYIVIGIGDYPYYHEPQVLEGPVDDAIEVYKTLYMDNRLAGYGELLVSRDHVWNEALPTKQAIKESIMRAVDMADSSADYLVIYFSGNTGRDFLSPMDDTNEPVDDQVISDIDLTRWVSEFPGNVTVIIDGSHSATMADGSLFESFEPLALGRNTPYTVLAGSKTGQEAFLHPTSRLGAFTHYLVEGMRDEKADSRPPYREITAKELYEYAKEKMEEDNKGFDEKHQQLPFFYPGTHGNTVIYRY